MSDEIRPALTPDEWARVQAEPEVIRIALDAELSAWIWRDRLNKRAIPETPHHRHGVAALCLHGQSFGFDDMAVLGNPETTFVEALRDAAETINSATGTKMIGIVSISGPAGTFSLPAHYAEMFEELARRIAALLPPTP